MCDNVKNYSSSWSDSHLPSCCIRLYLVAPYCHHRTSAVKSLMANSMFASARRIWGLVCTRRSITTTLHYKGQQEGPWKLRINANEDKVPPSYLPQVACLHNQLLVCLSPASPSHTLIVSGSVIIMYRCARCLLWYCSNQFSTIIAILQILFRTLSG